MSNRSIVRLGLIVAAALSAHAAFAQTAVTPQSPTEARIAFVKIDVNDLEASAKAYMHALGMQDLGRIHNKAPLLDEATLKFGDTPDHARATDTAGMVLVFIPGRKPLHGAPGKTPSAVLTVPDVAATVARAKDAGFTVAEAPRTTSGGYAVAMIVDPSGNVIELLHLP
jgi:lactoylglutathione lyase